MAYDDIFEYDYKQTDCIPDEIISKHETGESDIDNVLHIAQKTYGITYLYPWQRMVIENILDTAQNAEKGNQIILLPTGAGKSLCFMVPALFLPGPTLILYPLLALMADQKRRLDESSISSVIFRGDQSAEERNDNFRKIKDGTKFILANPEVLQSESIMAKLGECNISHIVIDEAHCVSEWGDSFRPAYLTVGNIIKKLHPPAVSAFTATASAEVLNRISEVLFDGNAHILRSEADRANIHYYVRYAYAKKKILIDTVMAEKRPLIIFCSSRKRTKDIALMLQEFLHRQGEIDTVKFYHAGLSREEKSVVEQWFFPKGDAILVSTCAFGMGVDKKDIKTVIHFDAPSSAEAYIQEAGRGGRDGAVAKAVLLWSPEDSKKFASYKAESRSRVLANFAESTTCRRQILLDALGAEQAACSGCDICEQTACNEAYDAQKVYSFLKKHKKRYTLNEAKSIMQNTENFLSSQKWGVRIWEEEDVAEIFNGLLQDTKSKNHAFLKKSYLTDQLQKFLHYFHRMHRKKHLPRQEDLRVE